MLIVLAGLEPGSAIALTERETILGRANDVTISIDEASISRRHARIVHAEDGRFLIEDLSSRNGTFVNGCPTRRVRLKSGDRIQLGRVSLFRFAMVDEREESLQRRLYESSTRDPLTGLANRRCLIERLELEIARSAADRTDTAALMIDVDNFKRVNDAFGHGAGDQVLRALSSVAARTLRAGDLFGRYGGEEFVAIVSGATKEEIVALAERLRVALAEVRVEAGGGSIGTTVSIGVAMWSECRSTEPLDLVALADERMYLAKAAGRNRVAAEGERTAGFQEPERAGS
jgi:two-component system cell cycle response regulator